MKPLQTMISVACAAAFAIATPAVAQDIRTSTIMTHPSLGPETPVNASEALLVLADDGVLVNFSSNGLKSGHAHTLWFVVIAAPENCAASPCTGGDVLKNTNVVEADAGYAGGAIADAEGRLTFTHFQSNGDLVNGWFGRGLVAAQTSEIHLVVKDHGPVIEDRLGEMLTTFRDGCTTESINPAFPEIAFADGAAGPNTCALVQHTAFAAPKNATN